MLSKDEISKISGFNPSIMQEALRQAEQRLENSLKRKENIEKKAFTLLFSMFLTFSTALFSITKILKVEGTSMYWAIGLTSLCFFVSEIFLFISLKTLDYGAMGRYPDTWLQPGILDGDDDIKGYVLANVLFDYQKIIKTSDKSNQKKTKFLGIGIKLGIAAPIIFLTTFSLLQLFL